MPMPPPVFCFVEGTPVKLPDGSLKAIERVGVGDVVATFDVEKKSFTDAHVSQIMTHTTNSILRITIDSEEIVTTDEHPFYVISKGWTQAKKLTKQDQLLTYDGSYHAIESVETEQRSTTVYNITVEKQHNYFVGHIGYLVHNKPP